MRLHILAGRWMPATKLSLVVYTVLVCTAADVAFGSAKRKANWEGTVIEEQLVVIDAELEVVILPVEGHVAD